MITAAVVACAAIEEKEYIMLEVVYKYIPLSVLGAEVSSLCIGRATQRTHRIESIGCEPICSEKDAG